MNEIICFKPLAMQVVAPEPGAPSEPQPIPAGLDNESLPGTQIVLVGERGRQGEQGPPGPAGGSAVQRTAGETLSALVAVYEQAGQVFALDPQHPTHAQLLLGVTLTAATAGGLITIQRMGTLDDAGFAWAEGLVFVGAGGQLTQEPPTTGWEIVLGAAPAPTRLNLDIDEPLWL